MYLPAMLGLEARWGAAGLTFSAGLAGWVEYALLRRSILRRIGACVLPFSYTARLWAAALGGAAAAWGILTIIAGGAPPIITAIFVLGTYALVYAGLVIALGVAEARAMAGSLLGRFRGRP
jgi:putative peptidoglycan lipid II flippase